MSFPLNWDKLSSLKMTAEQLHVNQGTGLPWRFKEKYGQQTTLVWRLKYVAVFTED